MCVVQYAHDNGPQPTTHPPTDLLTDRLTHIYTHVHTHTQDAVACVREYAQNLESLSLGRTSEEWAVVLKEHRCWLTFLEANEAYQKWQELLVKTVGAYCFS